MSAVTVRIKWFWLKCREAGKVVLVRPSGYSFSALPATASGVLVPGTVIRHPAYRANRASILDAINHAIFTKLEPEPNKTPIHTQDRAAGQGDDRGCGGDDDPAPRRAAAAGFSVAQVDLLGGHSLRSGFVTEAFRAGADAHSIMRQTGHKDPKMLEVYAREFAPLVGNAVLKLDL